MEILLKADTLVLIHPRHRNMNNGNGNGNDSYGINQRKTQQRFYFAI